MQILQPVQALFISVAKFIYCGWRSLLSQLTGAPPDLGCWLDDHPNVAGNLKWQDTFVTSAYDVPEAAKRPWSTWTAAWRSQLTSAFNWTWAWLRSPNAFQAPTDPFPYPPQNVSPGVTNNAGSPYVNVTEPDARELFMHWVALQLAVEISQRVPWSITAYDDVRLQSLFDSTAIMSRTGAGVYELGAGAPGHANFVHRKDNRGAALIGPPQYTLAFLGQNSLIGPTRRATIDRLLQWISDNCVHFYGAASYSVMEDHWQYRGIPPIPRTLEGTARTSTGEFQHWTAGCHGTVGLIRNVLRAVNIPVHIIRICDHGLVHFLTENVYLDHGDDPYNSTFRATGRPAGDLLIDAATFTAWFGATQDNHNYNCQNVGHQVDVLAGP